MENEIIQKETTTFNNKLYDDLKNLLATVFVQNVIYWCGLNEKGKKQVVFADGIYWTSLNYDQICKSMPFEKGVSKKQLQRAIKLLTDKGYIIKKRKFNDNNWYAPTKKLREFLGEQQYDNLKKYNNENYNYIYDKDSQNNKNTTNNFQPQQENQVVQPQIHYDEIVPKGYIRNPDGSIRRKIATDPIDNGDFTFVESFAEIMNKR